MKRRVELFEIHHRHGPGDKLGGALFQNPAMQESGGVLGDRLSLELEFARVGHSGGHAVLRQHRLGACQRHQRECARDGCVE